MKYIIHFLVLIFHAISVPLNFLFIRVQKWYLPMWNNDKIIYFAFAPFYWLLFLLTFIIGYPANNLGKMID